MQRIVRPIQYYKSVHSRRFTPHDEGIGRENGKLPQYHRASPSLEGKGSKVGRMGSACFERQQQKSTMHDHKGRSCTINENRLLINLLCIS
ncbi:hypothetical protein RB195_023813 [Necator americanus]|uniref:Uncharacterized protein n=1 Tax=Necator americanus TaxID=51031 RepID=A0ABR1EKN2_NECAM